LDPVPKFHLYKPDIALISGIAWDHINVFKTLDHYTDQFRLFIEAIEPGGKLVYFKGDPEVARLSEDPTVTAQRIPYELPKHRISEGVTVLETAQGDVPLLVFGQHNLQNMEGARHVCHLLGIGDAEFHAAMATFTGAAKRLEKVGGDAKRVVYKDFAHSPSKLKATIQAVREQFPDRQLVACMELHTYSSLSEEFLDQYAGCMDDADRAIVFYDPHAVQLKRLPAIPPARIQQAFARKDIHVLNDPIAVLGVIREERKEEAVLLLMSSGNFGGLDLQAVTEAFMA